MPYLPRSPHSSCIVVHLFSARHPGITTVPPFAHPLFGNSENTPESASSFHGRFRCHSTPSSLLGRSAAHSDSEMSATVTAVFQSSFQTAPGIGPFRGPCRIQAGFHASRPPMRPGPGTSPHRLTMRARRWRHRPRRARSRFPWSVRISDGTPVSPPPGRNHSQCQPSPHQPAQAYL